MATPEETAAALEASIEKWKRNAKAKTPDDYRTHAEDCPLCALFNSRDTPWEDSCIGCPVFDWTERRVCNETPYLEAFRAHLRWARREGSRDEAHAAALAEVAFLESLRKEP